MYNKHLIILLLILCGCAGNPTVRQGELNLEYDFPVSLTDARQHTIAVVEPILLSTAIRSIETHSSDFNSAFDKYYAEKLTDAMGRECIKLIERSGFSASGPHELQDDITYSQKKSLYLTFYPSLDLQVEQDITKRSFDKFSGIHKESGTATLVGSLTIDLIEPLSNSTIITKKIDISAMKLSSRYNYDWRGEAHYNGLFSKIIGFIIVTNTKIVDDTDQVLADLLNQFYHQSMLQLERQISAQEILSFSDRVMELKQLDQFQGF